MIGERSDLNKPKNNLKMIVISSKITFLASGMTLTLACIIIQLEFSF